MKTKTDTLNPSVKGNTFLHIHYKQFSHFYIDPTSHLIHYFLDNPRSFEELHSPCSQPFINKTRICLPFKLFYVAFMKTHTLMDILVKHSRYKPILLYTSFITLVLKYSFMTVLNVKPTNISLLNITLLLLYHIMKMLLISIIVSQWIQKVLFLPLQMVTLTFL